ncbi:MPN domain-containing protein-like isoform X2 [Anneissia japonica]|uniref:MPN domain-containing protein-like isoform X2 n=1 Tax=Anneissia japonica TaxID=1529436 RepID=UPI00142563A7|nr:MPN domain-containing protein-like isoform X2 [Anneissia japonica]
MENSVLEDDCNSMEEDNDSLDSSPGQWMKQRRSSVLTGRGVTLKMLMDDHIVEPGNGCLSIDYLGQKFKADLLQSGQIRWDGTKHLFNSPSAWAIHVKKLINPDKKSGCGWASVKYQGKKLDLVKSIWYRKVGQKLSGLTPPLTPSSELNLSIEENGDNGNYSDSMEILESNGESNGMVDNGGAVDLRSEATKARSPTQEVDATEQKMDKEKKGETEAVKLQNDDKHNNENGTNEKPKIIKYSMLPKEKSKLPSTTQVKSVHFEKIGKIQPFTVSITTNCLMLMDFHCHLTTSEVVGYLAGKWNNQTQHMTVLQAFPCKCRLGDKENAALVETMIQRDIALRGLSLIGWYHSHPKCDVEPSVQDINCQMQYQLKLKGEGASYQPCLAMICGPYRDDSKSSKISAFWVMPSKEERSLDLGMPMAMKVSQQQDVFLTQDVLQEMKMLAEFYKDANDAIKFSDKWHSSTTYLHKFKGSLTDKLPKDNSDGRLLQYIESLII